MADELAKYIDRPVDVLKVRRCAAEGDVQAVYRAHCAACCCYMFIPGSLSYLCHSANITSCWLTTFGCNCCARLQLDVEGFEQQAMYGGLSAFRDPAIGPPRMLVISTAALSHIAMLVISTAALSHIAIHRTHSPAVASCPTPLTCSVFWGRALSVLGDGVSRPHGGAAGAEHAILGPADG